MPLNLYVVDDHAVIRDGIRLICGETEDVDYVGGSGTLDEAVRELERLRPNVVLVDINLESESGLRLIDDVRARWPEMKTVVLSVDSDENTVLEAMNRGASGYITKGQSLIDLVQAVRRAAQGETVVEGISTGRLVSRFVSFATEAAQSAKVLVGLTVREREVLGLLAEGRTNQQIASVLGISDRTVGSHVGSIYRKLRVNNRVDAAREAIRLGVVEAGRSAGGL
jgi:DNA-binding NarL/FixJ family response regulator